jgi:hypothetical protein
MIEVVVEVCEGRVYHPMSSIMLQFVAGEIVHGYDCTQDHSLDALDFPTKIGDWIVVAIHLRLPLVTRERILLMGKRDGQGGSVAVAPHI